MKNLFSRRRRYNELLTLVSQDPYEDIYYDPYYRSLKLRTRIINALKRVITFGGIIIFFSIMAMLNH